MIPTIKSLASRVRAGRENPEAHVNACLCAVDKENSRLKALRYVSRADCLKSAQTLGRRLSQGQSLGRLAGVVFSVKDHMPVKGMPRSDGTLLGAEDSSETTCTLAKKLFDEDALCIGKANMPEYGKSYYTDNDIFGRTLNPFNPDHSPGGSSGGDAVAVATGMADFGLAADSGGSVRVPAAYCGLFGLFPTHGLFSSGGLPVTHTISALFRNQGFIARHIDDLELLLSVLAGYDSKDPHSTGRPIGIDPRPLKRLAYFDTLNGVTCDTEIQIALGEVKSRFQSLGLAVEAHTPPAFNGSYELFIRLAGQASIILEDILAERQGRPRDRQKETKTLRLLRERLATELPPLTVEDLMLLWYRVDELRLQAMKTWEAYDAIITPVTACLPPKHDTSIYEIGTQKYQSQQVFQFANAVNTLGLPAIAFPVKMSQAGLPIGLQIIGPRFSERSLINVLREASFCTHLPVP